MSGILSQKVVANTSGGSVGVRAVFFNLSALSENLTEARCSEKLSLNSKTLFCKTTSMSSPIMIGGGCLGSGSSIALRAATAASLPSLCGILVYREDTSIDASKHPLSKVVDSIRLMKSVVSLIKDGSAFMIGCNQMSTNWEIFSVILLTLETIGLIPIGFLCIFFRKYNWDVLCFLGGRGLFACVMEVALHNSFNLRFSWLGGASSRGARG